MGSMCASEPQKCAVTAFEAAGVRKFYTIQVLAARWQCSDSTIKRLIDEGKLRTIRVRKSFRIFRSSVLDYEARSEREIEVTG